MSISTFLLSQCLNTLINNFEYMTFFIVCSPSVLDRLNGLLEPGGVLCINERGVIDGHVPTIVPHPDFRLFVLYSSYENLYCTTWSPTNKNLVSI